ncbi:hypothetical protein 015DV004_36 [Bacillus phage 015DV004]|nr:hypothetical protein 015DV004_36 [Bacillus phage 015DV004]
MTKIYVNEMTADMLENVFNHNTVLYSEVLEHMLETEMIWIQEQLEYIKNSLSDWKIGDYGFNYLVVADGLESEFLSGLEKMEKGVPLLSNDSQVKLERALELEDKYRNAPTDSDEFEDLEKEYLNMIEDLADTVTKEMTSRFDCCYEKDEQLDYFMDFYARNNLENCYIEEKDGVIDYTLKEDISYTESYK